MYDNEAVARGYAFDRPPVHEAILREAGLRRVACALDVGCGAGRSTQALKPFADRVFGLEPSAVMASFTTEPTVIARAGHLPFRDGAFELITAAGVLNYVDNSLFLPEAARVLEPGGMLLIYDCSTGSRARDDDQRLAAWYAEFRERAPDDPDYDMDPRELDFAGAGMRLDSYQEYQVTIRMDLDRYHKYVLTETDVNIASWCAETLPRVFGGAPLDVVFDTYAVVAKPIQNRLDP